jgi:uncharacterized phage-associated protein
MSTDDKVTISVSGTVAEDSFPASIPSERITPNAVFTPDSTQSRTAIVQPENLRIVTTKPERRSTNVTVHDVAAFILEQQGEMTAMKLQKLVYYSQAWSLVWDEEPLFAEPIEAWANGPVVRSLYIRHQGTFKVKNWEGDPTKLSELQRETILKVLEFYGPMPAQALSDLTHNEDPWRKARVGLAVGDRGSRVISHSEIAEYYSSL